MSKLRWNMGTSTSIETRLKVKQYKAVRAAMNMHDGPEEIFSFYVTMSFWFRDMKPKKRFASVPSSPVGCYYPIQLRIERHQKAKLQEKECAYFHDSCSWRHFDSPA